MAFWSTNFGEDTTLKDPKRKFRFTVEFQGIQAAQGGAMLWYAKTFAGPDTISKAAIITGIVFGGLTGYTLTTKSDFSGLGRYLALAGLAAIAFIVCSIVFKMDALGTLFASLMVLLAAGSILYETSNIVHHYRTDQHVAAALGLFASVAMMFYYILYLLLSLSGRD